MHSLADCLNYHVTSIKNILDEKKKRKIGEHTIGVSAINKSGRISLLLGCLRGWHPVVVVIARLDGANKIRPNFTVQTAKQ